MFSILSTLKQSYVPQMLMHLKRLSSMFPLAQEKCEVRLVLRESGRKISSDVYNCWLEQV